MGRGGRLFWIGLGLVGVVGVAPLALVLVRGLSDGGVFLDTVTSAGAWVALRGTLILSTGAALLAVVVGTPLAWLVTRTDVPGRGVLRSLLALPYVIPPYVAAIAWINLASPRVGLLNRWLGEGTFDVYGMPGLVWVMGLSLYPFVFLTAASALENADPSLEDAARMSGASTWRVLKDVALPIMRPAVLSGGLLVFLATASAFGAPALLGNPARIEFLSTRIFESFMSGLGGMGEACSLSFLLFAFVLLPLVLRSTRHAVVTGKASRPSVVRLGRARPFVTAGTWLFVFVALVLPAFAVAGTSFLAIAGDFSPSNWTLDNFRLLGTADAGGAVVTSLGLAAGAGLLCVVLGGLVAWVHVKTRHRGRTLLAGMTALPLATPGTVLALGLMLLWVDPLGLGFSLANTVWILLLAYVAKYVALASRALGEGFGTVDDTLSDAARLSGARGAFLLRTIWIPLVLPSLMAAFFLVFMPAFSELTMSVLLVGPGIETVGTKMFELQEYEGPTAASVLATLVLALVVVSNLLLRWLSKGRYGI